MPYLVSFTDQVDQGWQATDTAIDVIFLLDILINFNLAFYDNDDEIVCERKAIVKNYLKGWFILDILASFPFSFLTLANSEDLSGPSRLVKLAKIPRFYRIVRFVRIIKVIKAARFSKVYAEILDRMNITATTIRGFKFFFTIALMLHLTSCL